MTEFKVTWGMSHAHIEYEIVKGRNAEIRDDHLIIFPEEDAGKPVFYNKRYWRKCEPLKEE